MTTIITYSERSLKCQVILTIIFLLDAELMDIVGPPVKKLHFVVALRGVHHSRYHCIFIFHFFVLCFHRHVLT